MEYAALHFVKIYNCIAVSFDWRLSYFIVWIFTFSTNDFQTEKRNQFSFCDCIASFGWIRRIDFITPIFEFKLTWIIWSASGLCSEFVVSECGVSNIVSHNKFPSCDPSEFALIEFWRLVEWLKGISWLSFLDCLLWSWRTRYISPLIIFVANKMLME